MFFHPFAHEPVGKLAAGSLDALFDYYVNNASRQSGRLWGYAAMPYTTN